MASMVFILTSLALLLVIATLAEAWVAPAAIGGEALAFNRVIALEAAKNSGDKNDGGYKFGDLTRSLGQKVTGDKNYQFGDISKNLDQRAKARVNQITGHKEYKFGDLSRWADSQVKEKAANFTGKANYQVGDISKEVVRRVWAGEYDLEDVVLMIRVMLQMGASFTPIGRLLPVKVLLEILNVGLAQEVGSKVVGGVAKSLDERFKTAITGDAKYQLGDKTKDQLTKSLSKFTGMDSYSFGDISKVVATKMTEADKKDNNSKSSGTKMSSEALLDLLNNEALADWDKKMIANETKTNKDNSK